MNKAKIKGLVSCIVFFALLVLAVLGCSNVLEVKEARKKYTDFYHSSTNFDVVFLGTSHIWNHILPMELWKEYGIASYNWGYGNCTPAEDYYLIQDIVHYTSPKVVVIDSFGVAEYDTYNNRKYKTDKIEQQHVQFDSQPIWSLSKIRAAMDVFDDYEHREDFIWNFVMYHNRWSSLSEEDFAYKLSTEKGANFLTGLGATSFTPVPDDESVVTDTVCLDYYLKIIDFCEERGIKVLCTTMPYGASAEEQQTASSIGRILEEKYPECPYLNLLKENILDFETDISTDNWHLNYYGAGKLTRWIGQYLHDHYDLDDYSDNASWQKDYEEYTGFRQGVFAELTDLGAYAVQITDEQVTAQAEIYDERVLQAESLKKLFETAGVVPVLTERGEDLNTEVCAHVVVRSASTGEMVDEAYFAWEDPDNPDVTETVRVES